MKPLIIYHASCADGFGAAFAAWLKFGDEADYLPLKYGFDPSTLPSVVDRDVYIVDFSVPQDVWNTLCVSCSKVVLLDHHKTAFEAYCSFIPESGIYHFKNSVSEIFLDNNRSGALLTFQYFFPLEPVPMLFTYLDDYDRWQFKIASTKAFNKGLWSIAPWTFRQWEKLTLNNTSLSDCIHDGILLLAEHNRQVEACVKAATMGCTIYVDGIAQHGLAANTAANLVSDVGHTLATQSNTYALMWTVNKNGLKRVSCSLRSNGDYDVSAIAKHFGGGGHKNAAGFEVPFNVLQTWLHETAPA